MIGDALRTTIDCTTWREGRIEVRLVSIAFSLAARRSLPVFTEQRTSSGRPGMSQMCQYQKSPLLDHLVG